MAKPIHPATSSDEQYVAWIFEHLHVGFDAAMAGNARLRQMPTMANQLYQHGYERALAHGKVQKIRELTDKLALDIKNA